MRAVKGTPCPGEEIDELEVACKAKGMNPSRRILETFGTWLSLGGSDLVALD